METLKQSKSDIQRNAFQLTLNHPLEYGCDHHTISHPAVFLPGR